MDIQAYQLLNCCMPEEARSTRMYLCSILLISAPLLRVQ